MKDYLIGCDIGTGGTKAVLINLKGQVLASHLVEYDLIIPRPGWAEQEPKWYWKATGESIKACLDKSRIAPGEILAVGLSSLAPACILIDKNLAPLQNSHIWMDRRATAECRWLKKNIGEKKIFELTGNIIDPYYSLTKLMWEKNHRPELYKKTYKMLNVKDYCLMKLTGEVITDWCHAALGGVAFDIRRKRWDGDMLQEIGLDSDKLPSHYPCDKIVGAVSKEASLTTGLKEGTPVVAGTVDASAAYISLGMIDEGENALALGSTACLGLTVDRPEFTPGVISFPHIAQPEKKYLLIAALVGGGSLLKWFRDKLGQAELMMEKELGVEAYDLLTLEAEKVPPGSDGLLILPYFMGERSPIWNPEARGVLFGLSFTHGRAHLIRALMESIGFAVYHNISLLKKRGVKILSPMGLVEGGTKSRLWRQIITDITGIPTVYMGKSGGAPLGDALIAGVGIGAFDRYEVVRDWLTITDRNEPDWQNHQLYQKLFSLYLKLNPRLEKGFHQLAEIMTGSGLNI